MIYVQGAFVTDDPWRGVIFSNVLGSAQCKSFSDHIGSFRNVVHSRRNIAMTMVWNKSKPKNEVFGTNPEVRNSCWDLHVTRMTSTFTPLLF